MLRQKDSDNKLAATRQSQFAFRRIQTRELYQPPADSNSARVSFRIRLSQSIRQGN